MISERIYRSLLALYPKEHRLEYGELMVQLFIDRMRRDGGGVRTLTVWARMVGDLTINALKERKEGADMRKLMLMIGVALVAAAAIAMVGVSGIMAKSDGATLVLVSKDVTSLDYDATGEDGVAGALRLAVDDGILTPQVADDAIRAFESGDNSISVATRHVGSSADGLADALRQSVRDGAISERDASDIARSIESQDGAASGWTRIQFSDESGAAGALRQAVEEGAITQELADFILQSIESGGAGG